MNGDRTLYPGEAPQDGDVLTLTLTAKDGSWRTSGGRPVLRLDSLPGRAASDAGSIVRPAPAITFLPGDVVVLKHFGTSQEFTYVRGRSSWPGERADALTDRDVALSMSQGRARLIARKGVAFPGPITKDNAHLLTTIPF